MGYHYSVTAPDAQDATDAAYNREHASGSTHMSRGQMIDNQTGYAVGSQQDTQATTGPAAQTENARARLVGGGIQAGSGDEQAGFGFTTQSGGQHKALADLAVRAFGGPSASLGARQVGAQQGAYEAAGPVGQAATQGASLAQGLAGRLGAVGGAQRAGTMASGKLGSEDINQRLGAQAQYGDLGGTMGKQSDQLAQFNASQLQNARTTDVNQRLGIANTAREVNDQKNAQAAQGATTAAMAVLSVLAML